MTRLAREEPRVSNWAVGLVLLVVIVVGSVLAYTKDLPFVGHRYTLHATFENAATLRASAPVRIAGVNVGEVTEVTSKGDAAEVTFTVSDEGRPVYDDAQLEIRPRLFLEGNFFLDLQPGTPGGSELRDQDEIAITQTATAVQLDEVLTALQSDSREDLSLLLKGYGTALTHEPTAADDRTQDPDVRGETAAESLNDTFAYGGPAGRDTAIVQDALRGRKPHDLSGLIKAQRDALGKLRGHESQLQGVVTNFNITAGALASEQTNLAASVAELAPTLEAGEPSLRHLSDALPPLRALARELEPSVRELPGTIRAAGPWLEQAGLLLRDQELGGLARLLGDAAGPLARTANAALTLFGRLDDLSLCATDVLEPTGNIVVSDAFSTGQPNFREFFYGLASTAGELQGFDGNGPYQRLQSGGGPVLLGAESPQGEDIAGHRRVFGTAVEAPGGIQPAVPASGQPPFRAGAPCREQALPNVNGPAAAVAPADLTIP